MHQIGPVPVVLLIPLVLVVMGIFAGIAALVSRGRRISQMAVAANARESQRPRWRTWSVPAVAFTALGMMIGAWWAAKARDAEFNRRAYPHGLVIHEHEAANFDNRSISDPLPEWARFADQRSGQMLTTVLVSPRAASVDEADRNIVNMAIARALAYLREIEPQRGSWDLTADVLPRHAFGRRFVEEFRQGWRSPRAYRVFQELRLTPELASIVSSSPASEPLPEWVTAGRGLADDSGESETLLLVSRQYATVEEAEEELLDQAANRVRERFHAVHPPVEGWDVPEEFIRSLYGPRRHVEEIERTAGEHAFRVRRVYRELRLPHDLADEGGPLHSSWRRAVAAHRLRRMLGGLAGVTVALFAASVALRGRRARNSASARG